MNLETVAALLLLTLLAVVIVYEVRG
jgi:hypothetical protein